MKTLLLIFFLLFAASGFAQGGAASSLVNNDQGVDNFYNALFDPNVVICAIEMPDFKQEIRTLRSGYFIESDEDIQEIFIKGNVAKANVLSCFNSEVEDVLLFEFPRPSLGRITSPILFSPFSGTRWIVLLEYCYNEDGQPTYKCRDEIYAYNKAFLNRNTLFALHDYSYGSLCIKWDEHFEKPDHLKVFSESVVGELEQVYQIVSVAKGDIGSIKKSLLEIKHKFENDFVMSIANKIIDSEQ